jgi:hypothetical protein
MHRNIEHGARQPEPEDVIYAVLGIDDGARRFDTIHYRCAGPWIHLTVVADISTLIWFSSSQAKR